jgi:hypothetical protein
MIMIRQGVGVRVREVYDIKKTDRDDLVDRRALHHPGSMTGLGPPR